MEGIIRVLVTGSNKGIGKGAVEVLLAKPFSNRIHIIMAVRNTALGELTKTELLAKYPHAKLEVFQLDQADQASITAAVERLKGNPIDWLVNNAGTSFSGPRIDHEVISVTMGVNYYGVKKLTESFLDAGLIKDHGVIVNVTSMAGLFRDLSSRNPQAYAKLSAYQKGELTVAELDSIVGLFEKEMLTPELRSRWRETIYGSSKLFLNIYTYLLAREKRVTDKDIQVYAVSPGWCKTDMTKTFGDAPPLTNTEGGDRVVDFLGQYTAIQPNLQGQFFENKALFSLL
jgi:NAD(P)-dependent dehydrogenase (short-subunit alcohol dehydrogenase family)